MSVLKSFVKFVSDSTPVEALDDLEDGRGAADGIVRLGEGDGIISPVNSRPCAAYYYRAFHVQMGGRAPMPRKLRIAEVYSTFSLEMMGGNVRAVPGKSDDFDAKAHRDLSGKGLDGFTATEDLIASGMKVRLWGKVKTVGDERTLTYTKLEVLDQAPAASSGTKKRKKKGKQKSKARG